MVADIPKHIVRYALSQSTFYHFENIRQKFPNLKSMSEFIDDKEYLSDLEITFNGISSRLKHISNHDYLLAIQALLATIEQEIKKNLTEYEGSDYIKDYIHKVFQDKAIRVRKNSERAEGQLDVVGEPNWYVYDANYGTSEEKKFVSMFARRFEHLEKKYTNIYLIRNEREIKIVDKLGRAFEPDFLLFCKQKNEEELTYQVFIEPKGAHLVAKDKWKEDFLGDLRKKREILHIDTDDYLITGVPFYNNENENEFRETLEQTLGLA